MNATLKSVQGRGRPKEDPLNVAKRWVLRYREELEEVEEEFEAILGLTPDDDLTERGEAVRAVADERIELARKYDEAKSRTSDARKLVNELESREPSRPGQLNAANKALDDAKEAERAALAELNALPDLGHTREEWENMPDELKPQQELGRPRLPIEVKLVRARDNLDKAVEEMHSAERARGEEPTDPYDLEETEETARPAGRPRMDDLGSMDRELKRAHTRMEEIMSEKPKPLSARKKSASGKPLGRRGYTREEKIRRQNDRIFSLRQAIMHREFELDDEGLFRRMRKRLLDEARVLRQAIRDGNLDERTSAEAVQLAELNDRIDRFSFFDALQLHIREIKEYEGDVLAMAKGGSRTARHEAEAAAEALARRQEQMRQLTGAAIEGIEPSAGIDLSSIRDTEIVEAAASAEALVERILAEAIETESGGADETALEAKMREIDEAFEQIRAQRELLNRKMDESEQQLSSARQRMAAMLPSSSMAVN